LRPGTPAANLKQTPTKAKKARSSKLTELFHSYEKHSYMIGREERVWINEYELHKGEKILVGHTKNYTKVIIPYRE
jgi:tRNA A37 methylthiotransferase MiaB